MPKNTQRPSRANSHSARYQQSIVKISRRRLLKVLSGLGIGSLVFRKALAADAAAQGTVTAEMIQQAEWIAGVELKLEQRASAARGLTQALRGYKQLREVKLDNSVPPAVLFNPAPAQRTPEFARHDHRLGIDSSSLQLPASEDDLAFSSITALAALVRTGQVSSRELTQLYLDRLRRYDPALKCVINFTEEYAIRAADLADREIAAGSYRGLLHGIPWGAKDLIAWPGYKTTWGATPFKDQVIDTKATVAARLEEAGAVLIAKLALGALAQGDEWFGTMTRNPWNVHEGSSGSSAGSACATAAGLVGFSLGTETLGSIVSPCTRCGATGLRPTFGRVSRYGCMTLSWSMDKVGPIARSVEDCGIVFSAIHGLDGLDPTAVDRPFEWPLRRDLRLLRVGYVDTGKAVNERDELRVLTDLGVKLVPIKLPSKYPIGPLTVILDAEASAVFDELTRQGITQDLNTWPETFRQGQFIPAVEYLRANRIRTLVMHEMVEVMSQVDLYVGGRDLTLANLTGHPTVVVPNGLRSRGGVKTPISLTFTGRLYGEAELLAVAAAYQNATGFHLARPPLEKVLEESGVRQITI